MFVNVIKLFVGEFAKLRKATISSSPLSVRMEQRCYH